ncbi:MAG: manganese efflux pump [Treponema sp.]|nr:manganese efflux pump [Treponema sp.]
MTSRIITMVYDFLINSILIGIALAMDAFSVCIANALKEHNMKISRVCFIASVYAFFQFAMPMIGWVCVHSIETAFTSFQKFIPWIALFLLSFIGIKMIIEAIKEQKENKNACDAKQTEETIKKISLKTLFIQGIATSIDALSVGFTISSYNWLYALIACLIIAVVTFAICLGGLKIGRTIGYKLQNKAGILGGIILIAIGLEIFIKGII